MSSGSEAPLGCQGLIGLSEAELLARLGSPAARRRAEDSIWLVFETRDVRMRVRCRPGPPAHVASWTASFAIGQATLAEAASRLGLWPAAGPDEQPALSGARLLRRPLACPRSGRTWSLTATVRQARITAISVFDESPEWI